LRIVPITHFQKPSAGRAARAQGAILGFANFLLKLYETEKPRAVLVGWDSLDEPTYRHEALASYQGGREFDDELVEQLEVLPKFVSAYGFANAKAAGYEADDFVAAAVAKEEKRGGTVLVATGDRDAFQLASENTTILQPIKAGELARIGPAEVVQRYGIEPRQVPDFIALRGDSSDKIPGAPGVGAKTADDWHAQRQALGFSAAYPGQTYPICCASDDPKTGPRNRSRFRRQIVGNSGLCKPAARKRSSQRRGIRGGISNRRADK
jgi:5'-3' exonuclease